MKGTVYKDGVVLPCEDLRIIEDGAVIVEGDTIVWVGKTRDIPEKYLSNDYARESVAGYSIMPGLIDAHMHISFGECESEEELSIYTSPEYRAIRAAADAEKVLFSGVTSSCDPGGPNNLGVAVRDARNAGLIQAPRMAAAGRQLTSQQGIGDNFPLWIGVPPSSMGVMVRSNAEIIQEIRDQVKAGVDIIKLAGSGLSSDEYAAFRREEIALAVDEAHRLTRPITIHARSRQSVRYAAEAGVDWIMHASYMDDHGLDLVLEKQIPICPAMTLLVNIIEANDLGISDISAGARRHAEEERDAAIKILTKFHRSGGTLICGSETGFSMTPYGEWHTREMGLFVKHLGLSPMEAILCMTKNSSMTLPRDKDKIGTITPGKYADLLVVDGEPHNDIDVLHDSSKIKTIIQGGKQMDRWRPANHKRIRLGFEKAHLYTRTPLKRTHFN
ncbi:MAG: dipeptidase [Acidiferrobacteraceae bacterium]|nr:dipeptidase [Acidiferrobacteraceae bacterium]